MKIKDVLTQQNATLENVEVIEKAEERHFEKYGNPGRVCNAIIKDETGELKLTLWNDEIDTVNTGDKISVIDGWVSEWQGTKQISAGRKGKLVKAGEGDAVPAPAAEADDAPAPEEPAPEPAPEPVPGPEAPPEEPAPEPVEEEPAPAAEA